MKPSSPPRPLVLALVFLVCAYQAHSCPVDLAERICAANGAGVHCCPAADDDAAFVVCQPAEAAGSSSRATVQWCPQGERWDAFHARCSSSPDAARCLPGVNIMQPVDDATSSSSSSGPGGWRGAVVTAAAALGGRVSAVLARDVPPWSEQPQQQAQEAVASGEHAPKPALRLVMLQQAAEPQQLLDEVRALQDQAAGMAAGARLAGELLSKELAAASALLARGPLQLLRAPSELQAHVGAAATARRTAEQIGAVAEALMQQAGAKALAATQQLAAAAAMAISPAAGNSDGAAAGSVQGAAAAEAQPSGMLLDDGSDEGAAAGSSDLELDDYAYYLEEQDAEDALEAGDGLSGLFGDDYEEQAEDDALGSLHDSAAAAPAPLAHPADALALPQQAHRGRAAAAAAAAAASGASASGAQPGMSRELPLSVIRRYIEEQEAAEAGIPQRRRH